jgi:RHS repeat-associated protein
VAELRGPAHSSGGSPFLYGSMTYDSLLRLDRITYHNGQTTGAFKLFSDFRYTRDAYGNISSARRMDGTKNLYGYNPAGEVVADRKLRTAAGNEFLRGQSFRWSYDGIGNRLSASAGGDANGQNLRVTSYTPNALNQYAAIQNPGAADVIGVADGQAAVTINGAPATRQGDWFHGEVTADNSSGPVWQTTTASDGTDSNAGALLIPPVSQSPQHDLDGNLTSDGVHGYSWDGENRLIKIETLPSAVTAGVPYQRVEMAYDSQWRRIRRERFDQASTTTPVETTRYLWAGWRCLADLGAAGSIGKGYVWGLDQAHQLHLGDSNNALLWTHDVTRNERHFCHYDGNGNITGLSNAAGNHTAEYFYNAFGETTGKRGTYADENDYRFSTKPLEETGEVYYYGFRYYGSASGRWLSQDVIKEHGGPNLYVMIGNRLVDQIDVFGLGPQKPVPDWHHLIPDQLIEFLRSRGIVVDRNDAIWGRIFPDGHYFDATHRKWFRDMLKFKGSSRDDLLKFIDDLMVENNDYRDWYAGSISPDVSYGEWRKLGQVDKLLKVGRRAVPLVSIVVAGVSSQDLYAKYRRAGFGPAEAAGMTGISSLPIDIFEELYKEYEDEPLEQICWMQSPSGSQFLIKIVNLEHMARLIDMGWKACHCE